MQACVQMVLPICRLNTTGFYWIRCYTASQLAGKTDIYLRPVYVVNKQLHDESMYAKKFENNLANNMLSPSIQFYAERFTAIPGIISTGVVEIREDTIIPCR